MELQDLTFWIYIDSEDELSKIVENFRDKWTGVTINWMGGYTGETVANWIVFSKNHMYYVKEPNSEVPWVYYKYVLNSDSKIDKPMAIDVEQQIEFAKSLESTLKKIGCTVVVEGYFQDKL